MAQEVFSTNFGRTSHGGSPGTLYTVPAGKRAVVKCLTIVWGDITVSGLDAWFMDGGLVKFWRYTFNPAGDIDLILGGTDRFWGTVVLDEFDTLNIQTAAGTADFGASGYLLNLP